MKNQPLDKLFFLPINLERDSDIALNFRADAHAASFGDVDGFWGKNRTGGERYLKWLKNNMQRPDFQALHCWLNDKIIGQLELGVFHSDRNRGHVNLYYVIDEFRGYELGQYFDAYAVHYFKSQGCTRATLRASATNERAFAFYEKHGWEDLGEDTRDKDHSNMRVLQKNI